MTDAPDFSDELNEELAKAIGRDAFTLNFHPMFKGADGAVIALEALLRWRMKGGRSVSPAVILAAARDTHVLRDVTAWTLNAAAAAAKTSFVRHGVPISVNVALDDVERGVLSALIEEAITEHDLPREALALEATELALAGSQDAECELSELSAAGHAIYIDDFRLGAGAMSRLRHLKPAGLKTDRGVVAGVDRTLQVAGAFQAVARLAESYGLPLIAKGVETRSEFFAVRSFGAAGVQGFLFGRPGPLDDVLRRALDPPEADVFSPL